MRRATSDNCSVTEYVTRFTDLAIENPQAPEDLKLGLRVANLLGQCERLGERCLGGFDRAHREGRHEPEGKVQLHHQRQADVHSWRQIFHGPFGALATLGWQCCVQPRRHINRGQIYPDLRVSRGGEGPVQCRTDVIDLTGEVLHIVAWRSVLPA
jgi:hypothetical protein